MSRKYWTQEEEAKLRELLARTENRLSFKEMEVFFEGRTATALRKYALKLGLTNEGFVKFKYSHNKDFFAVPNPINCYVAGFYAADGGIADNTSTRVLTLELAVVDHAQVEKVKNLLDFSGEVRIDTRPAKIGPEGKIIPEKVTSALRIYSAYKLTEDLEKHFGLTTNKTFRIPPPNLTDSHLRLCYLGGLLDGDGCVHINSQNQLMITYASASRNIVEWIKLEVENMGLRSIRKKKGAGILQLEGCNAHRYQICGAKAVNLVRKIQKLKLENIPILDRKWDNQPLNNYIQDFEKRFPLPPS